MFHPPRRNGIGEFQQMGPAFHVGIFHLNIPPVRQKEIQPALSHRAFWLNAGIAGNFGQAACQQSLLHQTVGMLGVDAHPCALGIHHLGGIGMGALGAGMMGQHHGHAGFLHPHQGSGIGAVGCDDVPIIQTNIHQKAFIALDQMPRNGFCQGNHGANRWDAGAIKVICP